MTPRIRIRPIHVLVVVTLSATALTACGGDSGGNGKDGGGDGSALASLKEAGVVEVGFANEAPYSYQEGDTLTGIEMEFLKGFFGEHDIEVVGKQVDFAGLIPGLQAKRYDMVGAGMYILPERCEIADFGPPEYQVGTAFAVAAGNPLGIQSYADVADSDAVYANSAGVAEIEYAEVAGVPKDRIKTFPSYADAAAALAAGRVDVVAQQQLGLRSTLDALGSDAVEYIELSEQPTDKSGAVAVGYGGALFPKSASDVREAYTEWLTTAREDGTYEEIMNKFGFTDENMPPADLTSEDLCAGNAPSS